MTNTIQNMWVIAWHTRFDEKDAFLKLIEENTSDWADAVSMFEVETSPPSGLMDDDGLPIASIHIIEAYGRTNPNDDMKDFLAAHPPMRIETVTEDPMWLEPLPPRQVGRFWIDANAHNKPGLWTLAIHSATAFGSGEHPTTMGCLTLMDTLQKQQPHLENILDLGCGSGILAIGARHLWPDANIHATDIDPEAIRVTERHADAHQAKLNAYVSHGCDNIKTHHFDLVIANILLNPLVHMTQDIAHIGTQHLITAGILASQADQLEAAYKPYWHVVEQLNIDGWAIMSWRRI